MLKNQWYMAVSNQAEPGLKIVEADLGAVCGKQVLPDRLARAAMSQREVTFFEGKRQTVKVIHFLGAELLTVPATGSSSLGIEIIQVDLAQ